MAHAEQADTADPRPVKAKAEAGIPNHGLNYKDEPAGAGHDARVAIDWGVYGMPETLVVSAEGRLVHTHIGPLTRRDLDDTILPLVARPRSGAAGTPAGRGGTPCRAPRASISRRPPA